MGNNFSVNYPDQVLDLDIDGGNDPWYPGMGTMDKEKPIKSID